LNVCFISCIWLTYRIWGTIDIAGRMSLKPVEYSDVPDKYKSQSGVRVVSAVRRALVHYLFHSGFAVEYGDYFLLFDFYEPPHEVWKPGLSKEEISDRIAKSKYPFVFVSHSHYDHYSPLIFDWKDYSPNLTYLISDDVVSENRDEPKLLDSKFIYIAPYEKIGKNGLVVSTFGSTDIGLSFLVELDGLRIFHAGDLNWWHWADESTEEELLSEERKFKEEVSNINCGRIDIMFFPVDPRLGDHYWLGGAYMLEVFRPRLFVPMHFGTDFSITGKFADRMKQADIPIFEITSEKQSYIFHR
jgi:L-ascorbate metabolism protein UlaG (beta-lactamase superfamily)